MEQFNGIAYYMIGTLLERVKFDHRLARSPGDAPFAGSALDKTLRSDSVQGLQDFLTAIEGYCQELGLEMSIRQAKDLHGRSSILTNRQVADGIEQLEKMIRWEMEGHLFLFLTPSEAELYQQKEPLLGQEVEVHFSLASFDIAESGKCLALSRGTACVMHLMRVLELGLNDLANELGVRFERREWENVINDIEAAVKLINGPHVGTDWREKQKFYSEAAKDFRYFKNAWRNHAMHARERYDASEAKQIFEHVKSFMHHLATGR